MTNKSELISQNVIEIAPLEFSDIEKLEPILRQHVRKKKTDEINEKEISEIKSYMMGGVDEKGRERKYFVAKTIDGRVLGCTAYANISPGMANHFSDINPDSTVQLLNTFVDSEVYKGGGVGKKLFEKVCSKAKADSKEYLVVDSGIRYKESWGFYDKMCDENRGIIIKKREAHNVNTWLKRL